MEGRRKIKWGTLLITASTVILIITLMLTISGVMYGQRSIYTDEDLEYGSDGNLTMTIEVDGFSVFMFNFLTETRIEFNLSIYDEGGEEVHFQRGTTPTFVSVTFEHVGQYLLQVELTDEKDDPSELEMDVQNTDLFTISACCSSSCFLVVFLILLFWGIVMCIRGYTQLMSKRGGRDR
jgi:hypothetical protein